MNLTSAMRSTLLANKKTAEMMSSTQKNIATGIKVSSPLENPNSYFTAAGLDNRAKDLYELLENMSQSNQTLQTSINTLKSGEKILQQLKAIASSSLENEIEKTKISKEWLEDNIDMTLVATDKASLQSKLSSAQAGETVYVFGNIDMGNDTLTVKNGVRLAGVQTYLEENGLSADFDATNLSSIRFEMGNEKKSGITLGNNTTVENLSVSMSTEYTGEDIGTIYISQKTGVKLNNLNVEIKSNRTNQQLSYIGAISSKLNSNVEMNGIINVKASGGSVQGIFHNGYFNLSTLNVSENTVLNIETSGSSSAGIRFGNLYSKGTINIKTTGGISPGIEYITNSQISGKVNIEATGAHSRALRNTLNFVSGAKVMLKSHWVNSIDTTESFTIPSGVTIGFNNSSTGGDYKIYQTTGAVNITTSIANLNSFSNASTSSYSYQDFKKELSQEEKLIKNEGIIAPQFSKNYNEILKQYDMMISDGSYKGVNLLLNQNLTVKFNEKSTSQIEIKGADMTSLGLGLSQISWIMPEDVTKSIHEIDAAIQKIRITSEDLSNYYGIITTRKDFTENLINTLETGRDKLVLADINQESAEMLALQVRQELGTTSLSLASQAAQAILKMFQ